MKNPCDITFATVQSLDPCGLTRLLIQIALFVPSTGVNRHTSQKAKRLRGLACTILEFEIHTLHNLLFEFRRLFILSSALIHPSLFLFTPVDGTYTFISILTNRLADTVKISIGIIRQIAKRQSRRYVGFHFLEAWSSQGHFSEK